MPDYTTAPATALLAVFCACCSRPLLDASSVETGVGPVCRKTHGYAEPDVIVELLAISVTLAAELPAKLYAEVIDGAKDARTAANRLVYRIAAEQNGAAVEAMTSALARLGYTTLAKRIAKRIVGIVSIERSSSSYLVQSPYREGVPWRKILRNAYWSRKDKRWIVPTSERKALWKLLRRYYAGAFLETGNSVSRIPITS